MAKSKKVEQVKPRPRRRQALLALTVVLILLGFLLFSDYGLVSRVRLEMEHSTVLDKFAEAEHQRDSLEAAIERLHRDTLYIERLARERFGMIRKGERVFLIDTDEE